MVEEAAATVEEAEVQVHRVAATAEPVEAQVDQVVPTVEGQVAVTARAAVIPQAAQTAVAQRVARRVIPPATQALPRLDARSPVPLIHTAFAVGMSMNGFSVVAVPVNLKAGSKTMNGSSVIGVHSSVSFGSEQLI
jgi:hypothetical protein